MRDFSARRKTTRRLTGATLILVLWAVLVMLSLKLLVGWATHSLALLAAAMHTLVTGFLLLIGLLRERSSAQPRLQETGFAFLMWGLLGFGSLSTLVLLMLRWQGMSDRPIVSLPLVQLMGLMSVVSFCVALVGRYIATATGSARLSSNAALMLKESWLNLLVLCSLLAVRYGHLWMDSLLVFVALGLAISSAWQKLQRELPQLFRPEAIAPEAIAQQLQRIDGVLRCIPLQSRGLVGRRVQIDLQLLIHPEFESLSTSIVQRSSMALQHRYGPADVNIELINADGSPRQRLSAAEIRKSVSLDFLDWN